MAQGGWKRVKSPHIQVVVPGSVWLWCRRGVRWAGPPSGWMLKSHPGVWVLSPRPWETTGPETEEGDVVRVQFSKFLAGGGGAGAD